jgi:hypothetical protein
MRPVWNGKPLGGGGRGWRSAHTTPPRPRSKRQAARECTAIQQALRTRALADQCWELHALIDDGSRDADMPSRGPQARPSGLVAGVSVRFYGMAAARVRQHRRALQRLAHVRATR